MVYLPETYEAVKSWTEDTRIWYVPHAKKGNTKSAERYERYSKASTVGEALQLGSKPEDLLNDFQRKILMVVDGQAPAKAAHEVEQPSAMPAPEQSPRKAVLPEACAAEADAASGVDGPPVSERAAKKIGSAGQNRKKESARTEPSSQEAILTKLRQDRMQTLLELSESLGLDLKMAHDLKEGGDTISMMTERLAADRMAQIIIEASTTEGRRVTSSEMLTVLKLWAFKKNEARQNVLPEGQTWVKSDTLGLVRSRTGGWCITSATQEYPHVTRMFNMWLQARSPSDFEGQFPCTSISVNSNYAARRHRDGNNVGPSMICAFGDFKGGELCYWPDDDRSTAVEDLRSKDKEQLDINGSLVLFDGCRGHEVNDFEGDRFSVVWFSSNKFWTMEQDQREFLTECGFVLPESSSLGPVVKLLPPPRGYTGCQSLGKMFGVRDPQKVFKWPDATSATEEEQSQKLLAIHTQKLEAHIVAKAKEEEAVKVAEAKRQAEEQAETTEDLDEQPVRHGPLDAVFGRLSVEKVPQDKVKGPPSSPLPRERSSEGFLQGCDLTVEKTRRARKILAGRSEECPPLKRARGQQQDAFAVTASPASEEKALKPQFGFDSMFIAEVQSGTFHALVMAMQGTPDSRTLSLTNCIRCMLHHSQEAEEHICALLALLAPGAFLPDQVARQIVMEVADSSNPAARPLLLSDVAKALSLAKNALSTSESVPDAEARAVQDAAEVLKFARFQQNGDNDAMMQLLQGEGIWCQSTVLCAVADAFALTRPSCEKQGLAAQERQFSCSEAEKVHLTAMEKAVALAFGELGGASAELIGVLMQDCPPGQLFARCQPVCGVPVLPMVCKQICDMETAIAIIAGKSVLVEQRYAGQRVQIHKLGDCIAIYGPCQEDLGGTFSKADLTDLRLALQVKSCIVDAMLRKDRDGTCFIAYDCLWLNGRVLTRQNLKMRREALALATNERDFFRISPSQEFSVEDPPTKEDIVPLLDEAISLGCSGLVLKHLNSEYEAGCTSEEWLAIHPAQA